MDSVRRRSVRTVSDEIFRRIVTWFAPILCFTMEEAWTTRFGLEQSVHLNDFCTVPAEWVNAELPTKWDRIRQIRKVITGALEIARAEKKIGSSLEAAVVVRLKKASDAALLRDIPFEEIAITSWYAIEMVDEFGVDDFSLPDVPDVAARFAHAVGEKCARCWRVLEETRPDTKLCDRCTEAVAAPKEKVRA
jgi:isoleucyl-tRNA synthetase